MNKNFNRWNNALNWSAVFTAFILPFAKPLISIGLIFIIIFWFLEGNWNYKWSILKRDKLFWAIMIFLIYISLSLIWSHYPHKAIKYWLHYVKYFILIPILYTSIKKDFIPKIISAFLIAMFISEITSYGISFGFWETHWGHKGDPSPFMQHIQYSIFLASAIILIIVKLIMEKDRIKEKIFLLIFLTTATGNLFFNIGRTGQLSTIIAIFFIIALYYKKNIKYLLSISAFIAILILAITYISPNFSKRINMASSDIKKMKIDNYNSSIGMRLLTWKILSKDVIPKHFLFGGGIGSAMEEFKIAVEKKYQKYSFIKIIANAHNQYLQILADLGIIGLVLFLNIFYFMIFRQFENQEYYLMLIGINIVFLVSFMFNTTLIRAFPISLFTIINGVLLANSRSAKN